MNELITAALKAKNVDRLIDFPKFLMNDWEVSIIDFILKYKKDYGEIPTVERLVRAHPEFVPLESDPPLPLPDVYDIELDSKRRNYATSGLHDIIDKVKSEEEIPLDDLSAIVHKLTMSSSTLVKYSTFDRDLYFREGLPTKIGIRLIDRVTNGVFPGEVMLIVGRLGTGKSTFTQFFMNNWFLNQNKRILCVSKEMPPIDVYARLDAIVGHFNPNDLRNPDGKREALASMLKTVKHAISESKGEIIMPIMPMYTVPQIASLAMNVEADVIVIDGMYHLSANTKSTSTWEQIASVSREVKQMALDLKVPIFATTQMKRVGKKEEFDPEDIAYSDALGQDADFVVAIRPMHVPDKSRSELQLIKNRFGPPIATIVDSDFDAMSMRDVSVEVKEEEDDD